MRLQRLERNTVDAGCPACHERRGRIVLLTARRLPDGAAVSVEDRPLPCDRCEQVPEQISEVIEPVMEPSTGQAACRWLLDLDQLPFDACQLAL
jgi:hypothetical protein